MGVFFNPRLQKLGKILALWSQSTVESKFSHKTWKKNESINVNSIVPPGQTRFLIGFFWFLIASLLLVLRLLGNHPTSKLSVSTFPWQPYNLGWKSLSLESFWFGRCWNLKTSKDLDWHMWLNRLKKHNSWCIWEEKKRKILKLKPI